MVHLTGFQNAYHQTMKAQPYRERRQQQQLTQVNKLVSQFKRRLNNAPTPEAKERVRLGAISLFTLKAALEKGFPGIQKLTALASRRRRAHAQILGQSGSAQGAPTAEPTSRAKKKKPSHLKEQQKAHSELIRNQLMQMKLATGITT